MRGWERHSAPKPARRPAYRNAVPHISGTKRLSTQKPPSCYPPLNLTVCSSNYTAASEENMCRCRNLLLLFLCSESNRKMLLSGGKFLLLSDNRTASSYFSLRSAVAIWSRSRSSRALGERCSRTCWSPVPCRRHLRLVRCCGWPRLIGNRQQW